MSDPGTAGYLRVRAEGCRDRPNRIPTPRLGMGGRPSNRRFDAAPRGAAALWELPVRGAPPAAPVVCSGGASRRARRAIDSSPGREPGVQGHLYPPQSPIGATEAFNRPGGALRVKTSKPRAGARGYFQTPFGLRTSHHGKLRYSHCTGVPRAHTPEMIRNSCDSSLSCNSWIPS